MTKRLFLLSLTLFLLCSYNTINFLLNNYYKNKTYSVKELYHDKSDAVVEVICIPDSKKPKLQGGSGFFISESGLVVTASHVIYNSDTGLCETVIITNNEEEFYLAEIIKVDLEHDVAFLQVTRKLPMFDNFLKISIEDSEPVKEKFKYLKLHPSYNLVAGDEVITIGYPGVFFCIVNNGIVSSSVTQNVPEKAEHALYKNVVPTNLFVQPGNSGGPVFDNKGYVIGVLTLGLKSAPLAFFQRSEYITRLLHDKSKKIIIYNKVALDD